MVDGQPVIYSKFVENLGGPVGVANWPPELVGTTVYLHLYKNAQIPQADGWWVTQYPEEMTDLSRPCLRVIDEHGNKTGWHQFFNFDTGLEYETI